MELLEEVKDIKFCFGDIVVVDDGNIGVVVKSWINMQNNSHSYQVYVRITHGIKEYDESEIERYMVRHKYLSEEELEWQHNAIHGR